MSLAELSEELDISITSMKKYIRGDMNPRADTIGGLADKLGITPAELVSDLPESATRAKLVLRAAEEIGKLAPTQKEECVRLFMEMVDIFEKSGTECPDLQGKDTPPQEK